MTQYVIRTRSTIETDCSPGKYAILGLDGGIVFTRDHEAATKLSLAEAWLVMQTFKGYRNADYDFYIQEYDE